MSSSEYHRLDALVREVAPELKPVLAKLQRAARRLSEITVDEVLKLRISDDEAMTLEQLRRVMDDRVVLSDLIVYCRQCLDSHGFTATQRRHIQRTLQLVQDLEVVETRQWIERFLDEKDTRTKAAGRERSGAA